MTSVRQLPPEHSLCITTPNAIIIRSRRENKTLFECESIDGIVNARVAKDNSSLIAIADCQVVVLYDAARRTDRKYKLKHGQGEPRLLLFSPDSRTLFFTTTLSTSLQAYSIPTAELMPSKSAHPSPPDTLALSSNGNVLLSASPDPPTIYLQDTRWGGTAPVKFQPRDTHSPARCAAFQNCDAMTQPSRIRFVLGFRDGSLGVYRLFLPPLPRYNTTKMQHMLSFQLLPVRVGIIRKLHKAAMGGITAAEFIPGYTARIVSIGQDGRCRLVDFVGGGKVLRT